MDESGLITTSEDANSISGSSIGIVDALTVMDHSSLDPTSIAATLV